MLLIKIMAPDIKIIERAQSQAELEGVKAMILEKIRISKTLKELGRKPAVRPDTYIGWAKALEYVREVLGKDGATIPPYPDNSWYARINGHLKREGMTEEMIKDLAQYAKERLRKPVSFDFLICQQHRIRSGEFDVSTNTRKDTSPEMPLLPED